MRHPAPEIDRPAPAVSTLLKFVTSGASAALLFLLLCFGLVKGGMDPFPASLLAYGMAFAVGYVLQRSWTFEGRHGHTSALPRYFILQAACALLSGMTSHYGVIYFHLSPLPMATATTGIAGGVSFLVSRYWVFPHERSDPQQSI